MPSIIAWRRRTEGPTACRPARPTGWLSRQAASTSSLEPGAGGFMPAIRWAHSSSLAKGSCSVPPKTSGSANCSAMAAASAGLTRRRVRFIGRASLGLQCSPALVARQRLQGLHRRVEPRPVAPLALEQPLEGGHQLVVGGQDREAGVVGALEPGFIPRRLARRAFAQVGHHGGLGCSAGLGRARVGLQQPLAAFAGELQEARPPLAAGLEGGQRRGLVRQPLPRADQLHRAGIGLVEAGVVGHIDALVGQLVEEHGGQLALGVADEGIQQRVASEEAAPAQAGVGGNSLHLHLPALGLQPLGLPLGFIGLEPALVAGAAHHRVAPGLQVQAEGRGRHHVPHRRRTMQVGIAAVAVVVRQSQALAGEIAHLLAQPQALGQVRRRGRVGQHLGHGAGAAQDAEMPAGGLAPVADGAAAAQAQRQREQQQRQQQLAGQAASTCTRQS
mmetsp:Transcript_6285/g.25385  ORF Transcript_6285/g.25385 Transcript_6285/m.25385 type:complete len:445 (-) Transcript_6285:2581-3915(-)